MSITSIFGVGDPFFSLFIVFFFLVGTFLSSMMDPEACKS